MTQFPTHHASLTTLQHKFTSLLQHKGELNYQKLDQQGSI